MTVEEREWTVLVTARLVSSEATLDEERSRRLLELLGGDESWTQYPPASGRGHAFETRWWRRGSDAAAVAVDAVADYRAAVASVGLEVAITLVHVASADERLTETVIGLERRLESKDGEADWNVMVRAIADGAAEPADAAGTLERLLMALPAGGSSGFARPGMIEVRFWIGGHDAIEASEAGAEAFETGMAAAGCRGWRIVRVHTTSIAEAARTVYLGVERRIADRERPSVPVVVHAEDPGGVTAADDIRVGGERVDR